MLLEDRLHERLGERVSSILRRANGHRIDEAHVLVVGEEVDTTVDVLGALAA